MYEEYDRHQVTHDEVFMYSKVTYEQGFFCCVCFRVAGNKMDLKWTLIFFSLYYRRKLQQSVMLTNNFLFYFSLVLQVVLLSSAGLAVRFKTQCARI